MGAAFRYYNAHPRHLSVSDCVKRSLTLTTGIPYAVIAKGLNDHKKVTGARLFYQSGNPDSYAKNVLGLRRIKILASEDGSRMTAEEFAEHHPIGRFVLSLSGHWTACINGILYDTWDCGGERVLSYYEVTRFERTRVEKRYCFTAERVGEDLVSVTVYDGNGNFAARRLGKAEAREYTEQLFCRGFFDFDTVGEWI